MSKILKHLAEFEEELQQDPYGDSFNVPGAAAIMGGRGGEWIPTPKQLEILQILKETPMLTDWTLRALKNLKARINNAMLREMYSTTELKEIADALIKDESDRAGVYASFGIPQPE